MDETAYSYCASPTSTITRNRISGRKQVKKRLTVAVACSADGSLKLPLFFVGRARQPRCFNSKSAEDLDLEYGNSPKGWMNTRLIQGWVSRLDARMRSENRKILLLLDNVSSHHAPETLTHVEIRKLPPNTTAHLQPVDAGIIRNFKSMISKKKAVYYANQLDEIPSRFEEDGQETLEGELEAIVNVDVLVAMPWAQEAWASVICTTISDR
uniref:PREDICTED: similar to Tigger transposable elementderived protein 6 putative n=1 Tax=Albugo laibachii Nc14 TaxID=890382 RepID=F0WV25_9STRA|nr:PREDICTED: similar to Tigger transposable elementderived protein 6 putative [Albugo laibachii Nc14]|eukprot:CCA25262.1 PREDICTED: similar to Tigger transposable elementderived protein 6 putative [Albugo laibachii Nc14]